MTTHTILVADASALGSLACIRSLGRAGHRIIAISSIPKALGFASRYAESCLIQPPYAPVGPFIDWLDNVIEKYAIDCIIPTEGLLLAVRTCVDRYIPLMPIPQNPSGLYCAFSKFDLFSNFLNPHTAHSLRSHLPPTVLIENLAPPLEILRPHPGPFYVKADASYARDGDSSLVLKLPSLDDVATQIPEQLRNYSRLLVQSHVMGQGVGVFFLRWNGEILAEFMHRRLHEVPWEGGVSSLRASWWHESIYQDARARVDHLNWDGVSMFEYRWDPSSDDFRLIELNARFWGSLHLPIHAGVDFPRLLISAWDNETFPIPRPRLGVWCRLTFPKEIEYVISRMKAENLGWSSKAWTLLEFVMLFLDFRIKSDMFFPQDNQLYWRSISDTVRKLLSSR